MSLTETQYTRALCRELEKCGCMCYPLIGGTLGKAGWPDRLIWHKHFAVLIEFKNAAKTSRLSALQEQVCRALALRKGVGHDVFVIRQAPTATVSELRGSLWRCRPVLSGDRYAMYQEHVNTFMTANGLIELLREELST